MPVRFRNLLFICCSLLLLSSCGEYEKVQKSSDVNYKLTKANEYYDQKQYQRANELYDNLRSVMKNTRNYEPMYYKFAYSFYYMKDYIEASYYFKNFVELFPNSKYADECEFMHGVSLYKFSPKPSLDQTNTEKALEALQSYVNTHPKSEHYAEAIKYISDCQNKLEQKAADAANLYFKIYQYKAASVAYKSVMHNYPETTNGDYYQYMIERSLYKYAMASIPEKQEERYRSSMSAYRELVDTYPHSKYLGDAEKVYNDAENNIKKIENEHK